MTLNRPSSMNALSRALITELSHALEAARDHAETRVIVLRGAGSRAFCAGADLKERAAMSEEEVAQTVHAIGQLVMQVYHHPKIVVAALNGAAFGGGLELALACDLRYAARHARLGLTETSLAIIPGAGGTQLLPRIIGPALAKALIFQARRVDAQEALGMGILHGVFDAEQMETGLQAELEPLLAAGPIALEQAKKAINLGMNASLDQGLEIERQCYQQVIQTRDRVEGLTAFAEKRKPRYEGR